MGGALSPEGSLGIVVTPAFQPLCERVVDCLHRGPSCFSFPGFLFLIHSHPVFDAVITNTEGNLAYKTKLPSPSLHRHMPSILN